jgi:hypothetical protein
MLLQYFGFQQDSNSRCAWLPVRWRFGASRPSTQSEDTTVVARAAEDGCKPRGTMNS